MTKISMLSEKIMEWWWIEREEKRAELKSKVEIDKENKSPSPLPQKP